MLDFNDPKVARLEKSLKEILEGMNPDKIPLYFHEDAEIIINELTLPCSEYYRRIAWLKDNVKSEKIILKHCVFQGDEGFELHNTEVIDLEGKLSIFRVISYIKLRGDKMSHFECNIIKINGHLAEEAITALIN